MTYHCIAVDFDYTLAHFLHGSKGFFNIFLKRRIPSNVLEQAYRETSRMAGFAFGKFLDFLKRTVDVPLDGDSLESEFEDWLGADLAPYPDSVPACYRWRAQRIPVCVLTAGEEIYQRHKVELVHIPHTEVIAVPRVNEKTRAMRLILERFGAPIVMIDDKRSELDAIRDAGWALRDIVTVHINRPDSPYRDQPPKHSHREIESLIETPPEPGPR